MRITRGLDSPEDEHLRVKPDSSGVYINTQDSPYVSKLMQVRQDK